jgi:hypothetical protein
MKNNSIRLYEDPNPNYYRNLIGFEFENRVCYLSMAMD